MLKTFGTVRWLDQLSVLGWSASRENVVTVA